MQRPARGRALYALPAIWKRAFRRLRDTPAAEAATGAGRCGFVIRGSSASGLATRNHNDYVCDSKPFINLETTMIRRRKWERPMAERKPILGESPPRPELEQIFADARKNGVSDDELQEQRISFAYGNAPENSGITKESVREASRTVRLVHA